MSRIHELLSSLQGDRVEYRRFHYDGKEYFFPYQNIQIEGVEFKGLRDMNDRAKLFTELFDKYECRESYLDVGCNLAYFPRLFSTRFAKVMGIDYDEYYVNMDHKLYPELDIVQHDLNRMRLTERFTEPFQAITALSMIEYINDRLTFVQDLYAITGKLCIIEGHSMDIHDGLDIQYENLIKSQPWKVERLEQLTDAGINAPPQSKGRPIWICTK